MLLSACSTRSSKFHFLCPTGVHTIAKRVLHLPSCGKLSFASRRPQTAWPSRYINTRRMVLRSLRRAWKHKWFVSSNACITVLCANWIRRRSALYTKMFIDVIFSTACTLDGVSNAILQFINTAESTSVCKINVKAYDTILCKSNANKIQQISFFVPGEFSAKFAISVEGTQIR